MNTTKTYTSLIGECIKIYLIVGLLLFIAGCTDSHPKVEATFDRFNFSLSSTVISYDSLRLVHASGKCGPGSLGVEYSMDNGNVWQDISQNTDSYEKNCQVDGTFKMSVNVLNFPAAAWSGAPSGNYHILYRARLPDSVSAESNLVLKANEYWLSFLAGSYGSGVGNVDGPFKTARFDTPSQSAFDSSGNLFIADTNNQVIRKVTPDGHVTTFAGKVWESGAVDGIGDAARFYFPKGLAIDRLDFIYVGDGSNTIRKISPSGNVSTIAGQAFVIGGTDAPGLLATFYEADHLAIDSMNRLYITDNNKIRRLSGGIVSTLAGDFFMGSVDGPGASAEFRTPSGMAVDSNDNLFVTDTFNGTVRKITPTGFVSTFAGAAGASGTSGSSDGTGAAASFYYPQGIAIDSSDNVYVADTYNNTIRKITPGGVVSTLSGVAHFEPIRSSPVTSNAVDGAGGGATYYYPRNLAIGPDGNLYITSDDSTLRRLTPAGVVTTVVGTPPISGSMDGLNSVATFSNSVQGIAQDSIGNIFVADKNNHTIRKITPDGTVSTYAGSPGSAGNVDGSRLAARFNLPLAIAIDSNDTIWITDSGNYEVRQINPAGVVTTLAGNPGGPGIVDGIGPAAWFVEMAGIAIDSHGDAIVSDYNTVRKVTKLGQVTTLAGDLANHTPTDGIGATAAFNRLAGVAIDPADNIYVVDKFAHSVRKVTMAGVTTTMAGGVIAAYRDDAGNLAAFNTPNGIAADGDGNVYISDGENNAIRKMSSVGQVTTSIGTQTRLGIVLGVSSMSALAKPKAVSIRGKLGAAFSDGAVFKFDVP